MLKLVIPERELYNEKTNEFIVSKAQTLQLEHSLVSLSKWESTWNKPFLSRKKMSPEETIDYVRCMTITQNVDPNVYLNLSVADINKVLEYIDKPMTATTVHDRESRSGRDIITAELLYYSMIQFGIPFECQKWHLNRLLTLINVCRLKSGPKKKMSRSETLRSYAALNAARRKRTGSRG